MTEIIPLFSTPLYVSKEEVTSSDANYIRNLDYYEMVSNVGWMTEDSYVLEHSALQPLKDTVQKCINEYAHEVLQVQDDFEFYITNSWVTVHKEGDFAPTHDHVNSLLSGVLYINIPENDESVIEFYAPSYVNLFPLIRPAIKAFNLWNSKSWFVEPKTGTIVLFPSTQAHGTTAMTSSTEKRYCLAFNVFARGELSDTWQDNKASINHLNLK